MAIFAQPQMSGAIAADGLAELQIRYSNVPIVYCDSRKLAEEWTYRFLAAAHVWARANGIVVSERGRIGRAVLEAWQSAVGCSSAGT